VALLSLVGRQFLLADQEPNQLLGILGLLIHGQRVDQGSNVLGRQQATGDDLLHELVHGYHGMGI
jgi:hypothetical protein